jgi:tetratricopeptide (TPR) repeat protein
VQSEVAVSIAHALVGELAPSAPPALPAVSRNPLAHQAYLKGLFYWNKPADEGVARAVAHFEEAIALDPTFGSAHAALARALVSMANYYVREPRVALEAARTAAARALDLDGQDAIARVALASVRRALDWDLPGAEQALLAAMASNPSNEAAHREYALLLAAHGRFADAGAAIQRACELDPVCLLANTSAAVVWFFARDYARALEWCRHTLEMEPCYQPARRLLAAVLALSGRPEEATRELAAPSVRRLDVVSLTWLAHALAVRGRPASARRVLAHAVAQGDSFVPAYHQAFVHAALGDADAAFALMTRACEERDPALVQLAAEPRFDPLRQDPRWDALVGRLGLRPAGKVALQAAAQQAAARTAAEGSAR